MAAGIAKVLFLLLSFVIPAVQTMAVIKRPQIATIATIRNGTERQITVYGAKHLKNLRLSSEKFDQCNKYDKYAPCTCLLAHTSILVDALIHVGKPYKKLEIAFTEYDCKSVYPVVPYKGFMCSQLADVKTIYRDVHNKPIEVEVHFNDGCELRCINDQCRGTNV